MSIKPVFQARDLHVIPAYTEGKQVLIGERLQQDGSWTEFRSSHLVRADREEGEFETLNSVYMDIANFTHERISENGSSQEN